MLFRASKWLWKFRTRKTRKKRVNCATIKETEKLKETLVGSQWNRWVATNVQLDHLVLLAISHFLAHKSLSLVLKFMGGMAQGSL